MNGFTNNDYFDWIYLDLQQSFGRDQSAEDQGLYRCVREEVPVQEEARSGKWNWRWW